MDAHQYKIKAAAELLFLNALRNFPSTSAPMVMQAVQSVRSSTAIDPNSIVKKEAVYSMISLGCTQLKPLLDIESFLADDICKDLEVKVEGFEIVRRKIASIVESWAYVLRPKMAYIAYAILLRLLQRGEDIIVRMYAAISLNNFIESFCANGAEFPNETPVLTCASTSMNMALKNLSSVNVQNPQKIFLGFAKEILERLVFLVEDCDVAVVQTCILGTIIKFIEEAGETLLPPLFPLFFGALSHVWKKESNENLV